MKIIVIGVGAVGGFFGGKLAHAGLDVSFIARGETYTALQKHGLQIESIEKDLLIPHPDVHEDYKIIQEADLILICVKTYHTSEVIKRIKPFLADHTIIMPLQNGIENIDRITQELHQDHVLPSVVYLYGQCIKPGQIKHTGFGRITIGEFSGQESKRVQSILETFQNAGISIKSNNKIYDEIWSKFMINVCHNGITALLGETLKYYDQVPAMQSYFKEMMQEVQQVARLEGHDITNEFIDRYFTYSLTQKEFTEFKPSTLQDIESHKPTEIDEINGSFIRFANKHKVDIPLNRFIYTLLITKYGTHPEIICV